MSGNVKVIRNWDQLPPDVVAYGEVCSTRVLAAQYNDMRVALELIVEMHVETAEDAIIMQGLAKEALDFLKKTY